MPTEVPSNPLQGTVQENSGPTSEPTAYIRHPFHVQEIVVGFFSSP